MQLLANLAVEFGRKLAFVGRGMIEQSQIAQQLGHLRVPPGLLIKESDVRSYPARQVLCVTTGSQGEPLAALSRIAVSDHRHVGVEPGDTVVFSARAIPGNEKAIDRVVNHLARRGADVVTSATRHVHVSGHGSEEELKLLVSLVRPRYFVPIHGEFRQRSQYARVVERLATGASAPTTALMAENGDVLRFDGTSGIIAGRVPAGRVLIDGPGVGEVADEVLRDRRHLAEDGLVVPVLAINKQTGAIDGLPDVITRGLVLEPNAEELLREASRLILDALGEISAEERADRGLVTEKVRAEMRRFFRKRSGRRPLVLPVIMEI
jgi:ribonuclease J